MRGNIVKLDRLDSDTIGRSAGEQRFDKTLFNKRPVIVDAGSRYGEFCIPMMERFPYAYMVCIEPDVKSMHRLADELGYNHPFVQLVPYALWYEQCKLKIYFWDSPQNSIYPIYPSEYMPEERKTESKFNKDIRTITLAQIVEHFGHIDLLKMNIEGAEWDIIENTSKLIFNDISQITMECHTGYKPEYTNERMIKLLEKQGYHAEVIKVFEWEQSIIYAVIDEEK